MISSKIIFPSCEWYFDRVSFRLVIFSYRGSSDSTSTVVSVVSLWTYTRISFPPWKPLLPWHLFPPSRGKPSFTLPSPFSSSMFHVRQQFVTLISFHLWHEAHDMVLLPPYYCTVRSNIPVEYPALPYYCRTRARTDYSDSVPTLPLPTTPTTPIRYY